MTASERPDLDLTIRRVIRAPRDAVWSAWTDPDKFEKWWVPAPAACQVVEMDVVPAGAFVTRINEDGSAFRPHMSGCFLAVDPLQRIVFTDALLGGWRPAGEPFMTAVITFGEHPEGTEYTARAMHRDTASRQRHEQAGFFDGWGTVTRQLAELAEKEGAP